MKNMKSIWALCLCLLGVSAFFSCSEELIDDGFAENGKRTNLTLTVSTATTRVAMGGDGMTMYWEPGDELMLINMANGDSVRMTTDITEPSRTAKFQSELGVQAGNYYVTCNIDSKGNSGSSNPREPLCYETKINRVAEQPEEGSSVGKNTEARDFKLYGTLNVKDGDTEKSILLNHVYAKVKVELRNAPQDFSEGSKGTFRIGMAAEGAPFSTLNKLNIDSRVVDNDVTNIPDDKWQEYEQLLAQPHFKGMDYTFVQDLYVGNYSNYSGTSWRDYFDKDYYTLLLPVDLTGKTVYFYVNDTYSGRSCKSYEFQKQGINLEAGGNYKIVLDFDNDNPAYFTWQDSNSANTSNTVNSNAEMRAHAYMYQYKSVNAQDTYAPLILEDDLNCQQDPIFPVFQRIDGGGHTISNMQLTSKGNDVGLSYMGIKNLNVENSTLTGKNNVALCIHGNSVENTSLLHCLIEGEDYVAGFYSNSYIMRDADSDLVKFTNNNMIDCNVVGHNYVGGMISRMGNEYMGHKLIINRNSISGDTFIRGKRFVGGLIGDISFTTDFSIDHCNISASIDGEEYVGGLLGYIQNTNGTNSIELVLCGNNHTVSGKNNVGGIVGRSTRATISFNKCYNSGEITGEEYVGGLLGYSSSSAVITTQCFNSGTIDSENNAGGFIGYIYGSNNRTCDIKESYSVGSISGKTAVGGFIGTVYLYSTYRLNITNSYTSSPTNSEAEDSFNGFIGKAEDDGSIAITITNSFTSQPDLIGETTSSTTVTPTDSQANVSIIAGQTCMPLLNSTEAYSTAVQYLWDTNIYPAHCPYLVWQTDPIYGNVEVPNFSGIQNW